MSSHPPPGQNIPSPLKEFPALVRREEPSVHLLWECGHIPIPEALGSHFQSPPKIPLKSSGVPGHSFPEPSTSSAIKENIREYECKKTRLAGLKILSR
jgi:hypothetical protein